ncbi:MAG: nucleotidyltransferase domain-containing protein [Candidatus Sulfotelmatobacter sp.]|jgi:predicted nucleotidyltransferase
MATTTWAAFQEFASRLEPTETQKQDAATKKDGVRDCLNAKLWVETAFLTGSYARQTMIRPPSDIDLFVVLDYSKHGQDYYQSYNGEQTVLERFHNILKEGYPYTPIRKDHPAVHLDFSTYGFDVIPAFNRNGGGFVIPNPVGSGWISTNPPKHGERTTSMNKSTGGYFVPLVKMFKSWNRSHYDKLTGFHLEMMLADAWPTAWNSSSYAVQPITYASYADAAAALFAPLSSKLQYTMQDPAGLGGAIDSYLSWDDRTRTRQRLDSAAQDAQIALRHAGRGDHYSSINKWRDIFGDPFPAYG